MIFQSFIQYLTFEKRFSAHTITAYTSDLKQFQAYLADLFEETDILKASAGQIRSWMVHLIQQSIEVRSVRRKRSVLNTFYNFALKQEQLFTNPMEQVKVPKMQKKLPSYLRENQVEMLLQVLPKPVDYHSARDRTIIELLVTTGMRRAELLNLKLTDVRIKERSLRVLGKRNKERIVPITDGTSELLKSYLVYRAEIDTESIFVFLTDSCKPLYPKFVYNLAKKYIGLVSSSKDQGPHVLRHTFATLMLDEGADINAIKELLGHADLNATQVYTHTSIEKLKSAYANAHPKAGG